MTKAHLRLLTMVGALAAAPGLLPLAAQAMPAETLAKYAKLPDWTGLWKLNGSAAVIERGDLQMFAPGNRDHPPYNAEWEAKYAANRARAEDQGNQTSPNPIVDTHTIYCLAGMPRDIATPFEYQFVVAPDAVRILIGGEARTIYTDGTQRPDEDTIWPKYWGWSSGKWEGETLVVTTDHLQPGLWHDTTPMMTSDKAVITERIHKVDDNTMQDDVVITDPVAFTGPWKFSRSYHRIHEWADEKEICGGKDDRNPVVNGRVTVLKK